MNSLHNSIQKVIPSRITYLEMNSRPAPKFLRIPDQTTITYHQSLSVQEYRKLYLGVGKEYHWSDRVLMKDEDLHKIISHPFVHVFVISHLGQTAGYVELDLRIPSEVEIAYFGIFPVFQGKGLGPYLLEWAIAKAWESSPSRIWVHTCDLDHSKALSTYLKAGFEKYKEEFGTATILNWEN
jgi:GNAT superfamily N-acetyltransferase